MCACAHRHSKAYILHPSFLNVSKRSMVFVMGGGGSGWYIDKKKQL